MSPVENTGRIEIVDRLEDGADAQLDDWHLPLGFVDQWRFVGRLRGNVFRAEDVSELALELMHVIQRDRHHTGFVLVGVDRIKARLNQAMATLEAETAVGAA